MLFLTTYEQQKSLACWKESSKTVTAANLESKTTKNLETIEVSKFLKEHQNGQTKRKT